MFRSLLIAGLVFFAASNSVSAQLAIENLSDTTNNRFTNDANFIGAGFDFSGVARASNGRWGTLISSNAVLTANHARIAVGDTLDFYPGNDPAATAFEVIVTRTMQVGSTDLNIAILDRNVNPSIAVYNFFMERYRGEEPRIITNPDGSTSVQTFFTTRRIDIIGQRALVFGRSQSTNLSTFTDQAVGENLVFAYSENAVFGSNSDNDVIIFQRDAAGTANALTHETFVRGGDSGAPTFLIDTNNELVLLGINSFQLSSSDFQSSGVSYTGNQVDEINAILAANVIPPALIGDCNFDDEVDFLDISPFISVLIIGEFLAEADIDQNGFVDFLDINPFINLLLL